MLYKNTGFRGFMAKAKTLSNSEFKLLLHRIDTHKNEKFRLRNRTIIILSFYLGLRAKELSLLTVGDVFQYDKIVETLCLDKHTKGEKKRELALSHKVVVKTLQVWIEFMKSVQGLCFTSELNLFCTAKRSVFKSQIMSEVIKQIYVDAGFNECSSHSGRRTFITNLANAGIDLNNIRVLAGHTSITTTQIYIDENPAQLSDIMKNL